MDSPDGARRIYQLKDEGVEAVREYFVDVWGDALTRFRIVAENASAGPPRG